MSKLIIGLTGGIGSGKTTIGKLFEEFDICCIDADQVSRDLVEPHSFAYQQIVTHFSDKILQTDKTIDRLQLRQIIFNNPQERLWLNNLLHPLIQENMLAQAKASQSIYTLFIVPLLLESKWSNLVDRVLVIDIPEEIQRIRTMQRDNSSEDSFNKIKSTQLSREERLDAADDVINNHGTILELKKQVTQLDQYYRQLAGTNEKTSV